MFTPFLLLELSRVSFDDFLTIQKTFMNLEEEEVVVEAVEVVVVVVWVEVVFCMCMCVCVLTDEIYFTFWDTIRIGNPGFYFPL